MTERVELLVVVSEGEAVAVPLKDVRATRRGAHGMIVTIARRGGAVDLVADDACVVAVAREALVRLPVAVTSEVGAVVDLGERIVVVLRTEEEG
jgi:hypothetical protein